jgi:hypothetical protein
MNVLSIDIDYVFAPGIAEYDDDVLGSRQPLAEQLKQLTKLGHTPEISKVLLEQIASALKVCSIETPYHVIDHHHDILGLISDNAKSTVYNFDHHHDVSYGSWHDNGKLDEGNWVSFALEAKKVHKYHWIRNSSSENLDPRYKTAAITEHILANDAQEFIDNLPEVDIIVFCCSPHWTFDLGRIIIEELIFGWQNA